MTIPTQTEYETNERRMFVDTLARVEKAPLADRKEAREEFAQADVETMAERVHWLVVGNYGYGAMMAAREVLARPRMNRRAWLFNTTAALEWGVALRDSCGVWNRMPKAAQDALNAKLDKIIAEATAPEVAPQ